MPDRRRNAIPWRDEADAIAMANDSHWSRRLRLDLRHRYGAARRPRHRIGLGAGEPGSRSAAGHSYSGFKQSDIGREFSLEGMLDSFTQRKNVAVNLNTPRRQ